jgi:DNA polymerase III epsilon subunit-like protein
LQKEDLLINPQGNFHLTDRKGSQGLVLPYKYEDFKKYPVFLRYAEQIYSLLEDTDTLVIGHAVMNDVKYLNLESVRFNLPAPTFRFADTQFLYMNVIGDFTRQFGLGAIVKDLGVDFVAHRAVDDAFATMCVAKALCERENASFEDLLSRYQITLGETKNREITPYTSASFDKYRADKEQAKEEREKKRAFFHVFVDRAKRKRNKDGKWKTKKVCFSHAVELQTELAQNLALSALQVGAHITFRAEECDVYVCFETETGARLQSVKERGARVLTPDAFSQLVEMQQ